MSLNFIPDIIALSVSTSFNSWYTLPSWFMKWEAWDGEREKHRRFQEYISCHEGRLKAVNEWRQNEWVSSVYVAFLPFSRDPLHSHLTATVKGYCEKVSLLRSQLPYFLLKMFWTKEGREKTSEEREGSAKTYITRHERSDFLIRPVTWDLTGHCFGVFCSCLVIYSDCLSCLSHLFLFSLFLLLLPGD